jgi:hypothetical protein
VRGGLLLLLALLLLGGCGAPPRLRLASEAERLPAPRFVVEGGRAAWEGASFSVWACPLQPLLWALTAPSPLAPPLRLTYGVPPAGLQEAAPAAPLAAGRLYLAAFVVGHRSSSLVLRVEADGRVVAEEAPEACAAAEGDVKIP